MTRDTRSHSLKAQSEYVPARRGRRSAQRGADTIHLHLERLEERIVLSGFGPEDGSYIVENREGSYTSIQIQPSDQKIVAAGTFPGPGLAIARYDSVGNLDASYGSGGLSTTTVGYATGAGLVLQPDGKAVVSAKASSGYFGAARFNSNGSLDSSFGNGGFSGVNIQSAGTSAPGFGQIPTGVGLQSTGKIVVGGYTVESFPNPWTRSADLARFKTNGATDSGTSGFGNIVNGSATGYTRESFNATLAIFTDIAIQSDDKVVAVGLFSPTGSAAGQSAPPTGAGNLSFGARGVALQPDGSIIVAGSKSSDLTNPMLMRFFGDRAAIVTPSAGLSTSEAGGQAAFTVSLNVQPTANVTIPISSSDMSEGSVSTSSLVFTASNWNVPQTVTITGIDDALIDGNIAYTIVLGPATSADSLYNGLDPANVSVTNTDDDIPPTKFYVVNDATTNFTYEYGATGSSVENYALNSGNGAPRGAASTLAGDKVWVIDNNRNVYLYDTSGGLIGSWTAGTLSSTATPQGITTNGTDVWIVDSKSDKVFKYTGAASRLSGSQNAASSFSLNSSNTSPSDIVTDGASLWVVNDSSTNKVFKYTVAGALLGSWTIDSANSTPTGITIDPANVSNIWIVDSGTDKIHQYDAAATRTSGSQSAAASFALAAGNSNPQGIADPPPRASLNTVPAYFVGNINVLTASAIASSFSQARTSSQSVSADGTASLAGQVESPIRQRKSRRKH